VRALGDADTSGVPAGRLGTSDEFGAVAAFLCSEHAAFVTGAALPIDGGTHAGLQ
jgi:3-oxoacyl-[acyl-carrier protein] reductase